jgi:hypothetical protein
VAADANFRLKLKNRKLPDVDLAPGWLYYVKEDDYQAYWKEHADESEVRGIWRGFGSIRLNTPTD